MFKIILQFFVCGITPLKAKVCHVVRKQMNFETTFLSIFKVSLNYNAIYFVWSHNITLNML